MAIKQVFQLGEAVVRAKAKRVTTADKARLVRLIRDMRDTMRAAHLVGIAAPQIGVGLQVYLSEVRKTKLRKNVAEVDALRVFINPKIVWRSKKETEMDEGCGSVCNASLFGPEKRPAEVEVEALDERLKPFRFKATGLLAKVMQHEYDHLQGVVILDKFVDAKRCYSKKANLK